MFDIGLMLVMILFANILPGIIAGISLLKGVKDLDFLEKIFIGAAMGFLFPQLIPMFLSILGIQYTYTLTIIILSLTYVLAFTLFFINYAKVEEYQSVLNKIKDNISDIQTGKFMPIVFSLILVILLFFTCSIRLQTISPLYMELDPYFYSYAAIYILEDGSVPIHDSTAWWPENVSSHKAMPSLSYLEANWYSLYTHGNMAKVDSYTLAEISNFYPPIAAMFTVFFLYLLFKLKFNKEIGLAIAALLAFMPSYLYKTLSGVFEAQPMAFLLYISVLALAYFFIKYNDKKILIPLAIIAFSALLGSSGYMITSVLVSLGLAALMAFNFIKYWIHNGTEESLKQNHETYSTITLVLAAIFGSFCIITRYYSNPDSFLSTIPDIIQNMVFVFIPLVIAFILKIIYEKNELFLEIRRKELMIYGGTLLVFIIFMASPFGGMVSGYARQGFGVGNYNTPLERTIAEQQLAGGDLTQDLSILGATLNLPIVDSVIGFTSGMVNFIYTIGLNFLNIILGLNLPAMSKAPSLASVAILGFIMLTLYEISGFLSDKKKEMPILLVLVALMFYPLSIAGMIKAKYTIYFTFAFILMLGYFMGRAYDILTERLKKWDGTKNISMIRQMVFGLIFVSFIYPIVFSSASISLSVYSLNPEKFADDPKSHLSEATALCAFMGGDPNSKICQFSKDPDTFLSKTENQFSQEMCYYTFLSSNILNRTTDNDKNYVASLRCMLLNDYWVTSLEWMRDNLPDDARVTSWWDYGHWTNFFSRKASVIRNEHASIPMIQDIAHAMIMANTSETRDIMNQYHSKYLMIDSEIILNSDAVFGSKFYALNYLACSRDNLTTVAIPQMNSRCEYDNLWEEIAVSNRKCLISSIGNKWGLIAVKRSVSNDSSGIITKVGTVDAYCVANTTISDGSIIPASYYLDKKTPSGDLVLNKGFMVPTKQNTYVMLYTHDTVWQVNGQIVNGYDDRLGKGTFYDSTMYKGFVLNQLEGFKKIYDNGNVRIYEMVD